MNTWRILPGDVRETLASLPDGCVQTCVTSPPYFGLRDYGTAKWDGGDPKCQHIGMVKRTMPPGSEKQASNAGASAVSSGDCRCGARRIDNQIGLEATPEAYVGHLVEVFREVRRVLADDGTLWLNLGDSYATNPDGNAADKPSGFSQKANRWEGGAVRVPKLDHGLKPKDLCGIPWRVAFALQADGWYLRSDIIWSKPNPMPESVTDRPTKSHEYVFLLSKRASYYYDADAVREPHSENTHARYSDGPRPCPKAIGVDPRNAASGRGLNGNDANPIGRNKRSVWHVATQPYPDAHFATYPEKLIEPCILAGTSEKGQCPACGKPWVRVVERESVQAQERWTGAGRQNGCVAGGGHHGRTGQWSANSETKGWQSSCDCNAGEHIPQTVLDPFCGSGTTGAVAIRHQRNFIGCELNPDYIALAQRRIGVVAPLFSQEQSA